MFQEVMPNEITSPRKGRQARIAIAEDEAVISSFIYGTLQELGYKPLMPVVNYTEALELLGRQAVDLFLIDLVLAGKKTGIDLGEYLSERTDIPFVFVTANADDRTMDLAMVCRPRGYLVKPFDERDLRGVVGAALASGPLIDSHFLLSIRLANGDRKRVDIRDVTHVETSHVYCDLFCGSHVHYTSRISLTEFVERYQHLGIVQIHKRFAVQSAYVVQYNRSEVVLNHGLSLPIGRAYAKSFFDALERPRGIKEG